MSYTGVDELADGVYMAAVEMKGFRGRVTVLGDRALADSVFCTMQDGLRDLIDRVEAAKRGERDSV